MATVIALIFDKIDSDKFTLIMGSLGVLGTFVIGYFAKDQTASHSIQSVVDNSDPDNPHGNPNDKG